MKCKVEKIDECRVRLSVEVESEPVEVFYQEVLSHFHKDAKIAGFRDGKAPVEMVEKKYAAQVEEETLKNAIPTFYHQILEKEHIDAVSMPEIANIRYDRGKRLTFTAEVDKAPDVKLKLYKGIKVNRPAEEVTEAELDKAMTSIIDSRAEFVSVEPARAVQKGDYILADVEIWQKDRYEPGKKNALLSVED
ncbi:MAG: trigger factor family protein, partial [Candidatus Omnitrophota bacterium]